MQYSPDLQNVPEDANRHLRGFSEGNKILEMKLKQLRQFWKIPLNALFSFSGVQTHLKRSVLQPVAIQQCCFGLYSGQTLIQRDFLWYQWSPILLREIGADCCVGSCSVSDRSTGCLGKDVGHWHTTVSAFLVTGDMLGGIYVVWMLMSISGDCGSSTPSWDRLTLPSEASFPSDCPRGSQGASLTTHGCLE